MTSTNGTATDCVRLSEFYRSLAQWPRTKADLTAIAEKISRLLQVPFVAVCTQEDEERIAFKLANGSGPLNTDPALIDEMLRAQFRRAEELFGGASSAEASLRELQISRESAALAHALPAHHLTLAIISRVSMSEDTRRGLASPRRREPGWVLVASPKALSPKDQILLVSAAQKLSELAAIARLEAAIQLRGQFLSIASHELKTPLTSIYGILQLQERMEKLKPQESVDSPGSSPMSSEDKKRQTSFQKILIRQVQRLNELIDGLLDVSRIQNGRFMVEPSEADVAAVVREAVSSRSAIALENGVSLNVDGPERLTAWIDPVRMEEVVNNLVMNAIRFSPEGGVVWIKLRSEAGSFRLTVRDQGPSVPVEDRDRIFQPFERAPRTARLGGLGLGLYISRQIAQLHGGNVSLVESVPGKGNVFEAYFPETAAARSGISPTTAASA